MNWKDYSICVYNYLNVFSSTPTYSRWGLPRLWLLPLCPGHGFSSTPSPTSHSCCLGSFISLGLGVEGHISGIFESPLTSVMAEAQNSAPQCSTDALEQRWLRRKLLEHLVWHTLIQGARLNLYVVLAGVNRRACQGSETHCLPLYNTELLWNVMDTVPPFRGRDEEIRQRIFWHVLWGL